MQDFDEAQVRKVAVQSGGRALAGFLDRVDRELHRHAARIADTGLDPVGEEDMDLVAGRKVAAGLGNADDRPVALQFAAREFLVLVALDIERGHARIVRIVEPLLRAIFLVGARVVLVAGHVGLPKGLNWAIRYHVSRDLSNDHRRFCWSKVDKFLSGISQKIYHRAISVTLVGQ